MHACVWVGVLMHVYLAIWRVCMGWCMCVVARVFKYVGAFVQMGEFVFTPVCTCMHAVVWSTVCLCLYTFHNVNITSFL